MRSRDWLAFTTLGLFLVPGALVVYAASSDGLGVENAIYSTVEGLRGRVDQGSGDFLFSVGRFLTAWWWLIAFGCMALSTLAATALAATESDTSVGAKALWIISFYVLAVTVPIYCIWQLGSRPNQSFKPTPSARLNSRR